MYYDSALRQFLILCDVAMDIFEAGALWDGEGVGRPGGGIQEAKELPRASSLLGLPPSDFPLCPQSLWS